VVGAKPVGVVAVEVVEVAAVRLTGEPNALSPVVQSDCAGKVVNGPQVKNWTVPVGDPAVEETVAVSVKGLVELAWVVRLVPPTTSKHSLVVVVE
jgi:hypothetical protein